MAAIDRRHHWRQPVLIWLRIKPSWAKITGSIHPVCDGLDWDALAGYPDFKSWHQNHHENASSMVKPVLLDHYAVRVQPQILWRWLTLKKVKGADFWVIAQTLFRLMSAKLTPAMIKQAADAALFRLLSRCWSAISCHGRPGLAFYCWHLFCISPLVSCQGIFIQKPWLCTTGHYWCCPAPLSLLRNWLGLLPSKWRQPGRFMVCCWRIFLNSISGTVCWRIYWFCTQLLMIEIKLMVWNMPVKDLRV